MDKANEAIGKARAELPSIEVKLGEGMKKHTSFKIGGSVRAMYFPQTPRQFSTLYNIVFETFGEGCGAPLIMGNGTNLLVSDEPLDLIVINTSKLTGIEKTGELEITAAAGIMLSKLAVFAMEHELKGLEFAHGIPGSLGGAIFMNAGAYGGEMKDVVQRVTAFAPAAGIKTIERSALDFSYRHSCFCDTGDLVLSSVIKLQKGEAGEIRTAMDELSVKRRTSQPLDLPSAGSVFKRPKDGYVGAMVEQAGLKGYSIGGAQISEKHAGFIVNKGGATFSDVSRLISHIQETILKQFGIALETEIRIVS